MLPVTNNILDQLLGGFETNPLGAAGSAGVADKSTPGGLMFGELLAQLSAGVDPTVNPLNTKIINSLFPSIDQPAAQDGAPAGLTVYLDSLIGMGAVAPQNMAADLALPVNPEVMPEANLPQAWIATTPLKAPELLAVSETPTVQPTNSLAELPTGVYNIIDARIDGGQVMLTATTDGATAEPVRISVPLQVIGQVLAEKILAAGAETFGRGSESTVAISAKPGANQLDQLLKSLNLKTIEINNIIDTSLAKTAANGAEITLIAENNGARLTLTTKLNRHDFKFAFAGKQSFVRLQSLARLETAPESNTPNPLSLVQQQEADTIMPAKRGIVENKFNLSERLMTSLNLDSSDNGLQSILTKTDVGSGNVETVSRQTMTTTVKLTLPDSIQKPFSSQGQTIMIRIEPEHLGPARLNLTVRDQILTARVTVDTPVAKLAVERSLDQLTDQLSRAGIDVDRIDVMLSDHGSREQFFDRRPLWSHARKLHDRNDADRFNSDVIAAPVLMLQPMRQYVSYNGVNLWA